MGRGLVAVDKDSKPEDSLPNACALAGSAVFGAPYLIPLEPIIEPPLIAAQYAGIKFAASAIIDAAYLTVEGLFDQATTVHSDLWLTKASRVIFMSYFVELPALDDAGLSKAWKGLEAVMARLQNSTDFLVVAPMEFRFVRGRRHRTGWTIHRNPQSDIRQSGPYRIRAGGRGV